MQKMNEYFIVFKSSAKMILLFHWLVGLAQFPALFISLRKRVREDAKNG